MRRCWSRLLPGVVALTAASTVPFTASALEPHDRTGFFIGFGLGGGYAAWDWVEESDDDPGEGSGVAQFRIGGAVQENLLLGFEGSSWVKDYEVEFLGDDVGDATVSFTAATFSATWFPRNLGWFLRGGIGFARARAEVTIEGTGGFDVFSAESTDSGFAVLGATGYEWRFTRKFAMGPQVEVFYLAMDGDLVENVFVVDGALQFNWYW